MLPNLEQETPQAEAARVSRIAEKKGLLAEGLLLSDQLMLDVTGPNLQLPVLLEFFGFKGLCKILEEDIVHFAYCPGVISYLTAEKVRGLGLTSPPGMHRFVGTDVAWSDPFESSELALREQTNLRRVDRRLLSRLVARNTKVLPGDKIFQEGVRLANADIKSPLGKELGFTPEDVPERGDFQTDKETHFRELAHYNMLYLCMVISKCSDTVAKELAYRVLQNRVVVEPRFKDRVEILQTILEFEDIPDVKDLIASGRLSLKAILEIRKSKHLREFRQWLGKLPSESKDLQVLKAYRRAVEDKVSSKTGYKILKLGMFTGAGMGIGTMLGPAGTVAGAIAGAAADLALGYTDAFFVDQFVDGWNPKIFIEKEIKSRV